MKGFFITSNNTGVGKTHIGARIIESLKTDIDLSVRKPVESDCKNINGDLFPSDANKLYEASGRNENIDTVCRFKFEMYASPRLAASHAKTNLTIQDLFETCQTDKEFLIVEGAGGILSPIAEDGLNADLISKLGLPVIIVVNDELGAINQALLTINAAEQRKIKIMCVILNQITEERDTSLNNKSELQEFTRHPVLKYNEKETDSFVDEVKKLINNF